MVTVLRGVNAEAPLRQAAALLSDADAVIDEFAAALQSACGDICALMKDNHEGGLIPARVEKYLLDHFARTDLSLTEIADSLKLSEGHISRCFKLAKGTSVMQCLGALRLSHAQALLKETDLPLDDIISRCGYSDKGSFIRTFKKASFVTPMQYRKIVRETPPDDLTPR